MNIGVLGTGMVGNSIARKLIDMGHAVKMGSRSADNEKAKEWVNKSGANASQGTFGDAASFGEIIFLCLHGAGTLEALDMAGIENFNDKIVIDITNPLDLSKGMPPTLFVSNTDSLGEQVQQKLPGARVVKTLNIVNSELMVNPALIPGDPDMLLCGDDGEAKKQVTTLLNDFGWKQVIDLGGIKSARNMESFVLLWVNVYQTLGNPYFALKFLTK
jgi:predicted dinucleotide-binding enzyme